MQRANGPQIIRSLNEMLEEERAAVEAMIGLTAMATDFREREMMQRIGANEVWACVGLRERIVAMGGIPSTHISDFANYVLSLEFFPERLRTFSRHQRLIIERINTLLKQSIDDSTRQFLEEMNTHLSGNVVWSDARAAAFDASRPAREQIMPPRNANLYNSNNSNTRFVEGNQSHNTISPTVTVSQSMNVSQPKMTTSPVPPLATVIVTPNTSPAKELKTTEIVVAAEEEQSPAEKPRRGRRRVAAGDDEGDAAPQTDL